MPFYLLVLFSWAKGLLLALLFFPSLIALASGLLPLALAPMVPFIISANIVLIVVFKWMESKGFFKAAFLAAASKFAFLSFVSSAVFAPIFHFGPAMIAMMGYMQFVTALFGAFLAGGVLKTTKPYKTN